MKRISLLLTLLVLVLLGALLARLNADSVVLDFYISTIEIPLALLLYLVLALGVLTGIVVSLIMVVRARREARRLRKRLQLCEQEVKNLRELPIKGQF